MTRNSLLAACILAVLTVAIGCREGRSSLEKACPHDDGLPTYSQWQSQVVLPYTASRDKLQRVKANYDHVGVGSAKPQIIAAFGPPDYENESYPKVQNQPCIYEFVYYFEKPTDLANEFKDKRIEVFFTHAGRARWIVGNVGLSEKGGPGPILSD